MTMPTGVLLMAYGSPATLRDVKAYYTHIRGGRTPPAEQVADKAREQLVALALLHAVAHSRDPLAGWRNEHGQALAA